MLHSRYHRFVGLLAVASAACQPSPPEQDLMWRHFDHVTELQAAVVDGDLARARLAADAVALSEPVPGITDQGRPYAEALRDQARIGATAPDLLAAGRSVGHIGRSCGECHNALQRGPHFAGVRRRATSEQPVTDAMLRHLWATDQLWNGLIGPSDTSWQAGARALTEQATYMELIRSNVPRGDAMRALAASVQQMGRTAEAEKDAGNRAVLYGQLLASCNTCHELSKVR